MVHTPHLPLYNLDFVLLTAHITTECRAWAVRHCAVLGLSRVCTAHRPLAGRDGLGGVAWSLLMQGHSTERDSRVLEAYRMSQVCVLTIRQTTGVCNPPMHYLCTVTHGHNHVNVASSLMPMHITHTYICGCTCAQCMHVVAQVYPDIDGQLLAVESGPLSSPMLAHIADQLASSLLPPPPLTTAFSSSTSTGPPKRCMLSHMKCMYA